MPVPAYAYLNHEYLNNFMGNQNGVNTLVDLARSPLNLHQRVAMSFTQGDLLTAILKGNGQLCWEWGGAWDAQGPDHASVVALMRHLNAWRKGAGKTYLLYGRMIKPWALSGDFDIPMYTSKGQQIHFRSVFTSRWLHGTKTAQFLVNYTPEPQELIVQPIETAPFLHVIGDPAHEKGTRIKIPKDGRLPVTVPSLSAIMLEE